MHAHTAFHSKLRALATHHPNPDPNPPAFHLFFLRLFLQGYDDWLNPAPHPGYGADGPGVRSPSGGDEGSAGGSVTCAAEAKAPVISSEPSFSSHLPKGPGELLKEKSELGRERGDAASVADAVCCDAEVSAAAAAAAEVQRVVVHGPAVREVTWLRPLQAKAVACSPRHVVVVTADNRMVMWGDEACLSHQMRAQHARRWVMHGCVRVCCVTGRVVRLRGVVAGCGTLQTGCWLSIHTQSHTYAAHSHAVAT